MIEIRNLNPYKKDRWGLYGGLSGSKYGILIDGCRWMVKFPENTKNFPGTKSLAITFPPTPQVPSVSILAQRYTNPSVFRYMKSFLDTGMEKLWLPVKILIHIIQWLITEKLKML